MRAQDPGKRSDTAEFRRTSRAPAPTAAPGHGVTGGAEPSAAAMFALQRSIGNAAAARLVDEARHRHGAGCGHQEAPVVQRSTVHDVLRGSGQPLHGPVREEMESRLGADFSDVRLHTDITAQRSASEIGARAYTSGSHIVIGSGGADRHTLAHELTHVIQQRQGPVAGTDHSDGLTMSDPSDRYERAAEENATKVMQGPAPQAADRAAEPASEPASQAPGTGPVQRKLEYGAWSAKYIKNEQFMSLFPPTERGAGAEGFEAPFLDLVKQVEQGGREVYFQEQPPSVSGARASFRADGGSGSLAIQPPAEGAGPAVLREFATTLTHELQHAVDFINKRFPADKGVKYADDTEQNKKIGHLAAELRAFGVEAAAGAKLALGDHYAVDEKPFSSLVSALSSSSISPEQKALAIEFQHLASYSRTPKGILAAFGPAININSSKLLERTAAYLSQYKIVPQIPSSADTLEWLRNNPQAVTSGLAEGTQLYLSRRPQLKK
ncbi:eCIS core domain-containing protein [Streptomyces pinistramenti]|uniref:eCIS core domain-containing protein n=1 Tax=Streptomyces pinistramenti TaxID=2884812 RepID=UPI001D08B2FD|nr:DUF4157 domain-containing protein [Streptomyces pinistramenti]MCB5910246.1 DUF4157 domain-containing protein [Streptomyces pinistramenti]